VYIVTCKFVTDVTAWMIAYQPVGCGGAGFMGNLFVNQVATLVVAGAYVGGAGAVGEQRIDGDTVWAVVLASNGVLVLSFAAFFGTINRSHVSAFFSFETAADQVERMFREHTEPGLKLGFLALAFHESCHRHFRIEVKEYVEANIAEWESERPLWFTNNMLVKIPDDWLGGDGGAKTLRRKRALEAGDGRRNRSSVRQSLGMSVGVVQEEEDEEDSAGEGGGGGGGEKVTPVN
jgi:hypothetical protein